MLYWQQMLVFLDLILALYVPLLGPWHTTLYGGSGQPACTDELKVGFLLLKRLSTYREYNVLTYNMHDSATIQIFKPLF